MAIFNSYVKLPEGTLLVTSCNMCSLCRVFWVPIRNTRRLVPTSDDCISLQWDQPRFKRRRLYTQIYQKCSFFCVSESENKLPFYPTSIPWFNYHHLPWVIRTKDIMFCPDANKRFLGQVLLHRLCGSMAYFKLFLIDRISFARGKYIN